MKHSFKVASLLIIVGAAGCGGDSGTDPRDRGPEPGTLDFDSDLVNLFETRSTAVVLVNGTEQTVNGVTFGVGSTFDESGVDVGGVRGTAIPPQAPSIRPGGEVSVSVNLNDTGLPTGIYETVFEARIDAEAQASVRLRFEVPPGSTTSAVSVEIVEGPSSLRQGDPVVYVGDARNDRDEPLPPEFIEWFVLPVDAGLLKQSGLLVPYRTGSARVIARSGLHFDTLDIQITPRNTTGSLEVVGRGSGAGALDVDVSETTAWLATVEGSVEAWDVSAPGAPVPSGSLSLDASTVPAVHIRADGRLAAAAHSGSQDGDNGVTLFDPSDPTAPAVLSRFTEGLEAGVSDVLLNGELLFAVEEGGAVRIIDVSDPSQPATLAVYDAGTSFAETVVVRNGLLYVAHWNAGARIVDVGDGVGGGSPDNPVEIGNMISKGGQVAHVTLLPEKSIALLSEADPNGPGSLHLMRIPESGAGQEIGDWAVPGAPPGATEVHESGERIVAAWGAAGVRLLDVTDELLGELDRQGRQLAVSLYDGETTDAVAVTLVGDLAYIADATAGLVILRIG